MSPELNALTVDAHFTNREPAVRAIYQAVLAAARKLGPVKVEVKKTSIHLVRKTAFAGVATRKAALILTLKADAELASPRVMKAEQTSANRWHHDIKLVSAREVDSQLVGWLKDAYALAE